MMQTIVQPVDMQQVVYQPQQQLLPQTVVSGNRPPVPMEDEPIDYSIGPNLPGAHVCVCVCVCVCVHARERAARVCHRCLRQKSVRVRTPLMYGYLTSCFVSTHVSRISARLGKVMATNPASLEAKAFHPQQLFVGHSWRGAHNNANNARATQSFSLLSLRVGC